MRVCVIGFGNIAKKHIDVFRHLGHEVVASSNRSEAGNILAKEYGIKKTYLGYLEMVDKEKPDAIINCVSFQHIFETTRNLIPFNIPLLIEKPAGLSIHDLNELIELQVSYQTIIQVGLNRRHYSLFNKVIALIGGSEKMDMMSVEWSERPLQSKLIKKYSDELVNNLIIANSIHGVDTLDFLSGGIETYQIFTKESPGYFNRNMLITGRSKTGCLVNFSSSWGCPVPWRINMFGNGKRYEFAPLETCKVFEEGKAGLVSIEPDKEDNDFKAGFYNQSRYFLDMIENKSVINKHNLSSTMNSMTIVEQMLNSFNLSSNE